MSPLTADWSKVKHFKPEEFLFPEKMNPLLIYSLDRLRDIAGRPIIINKEEGTFREGDPGQHGLGNAADGFILGLSLIDQFLISEKLRLFSGLGLYPYWNRPGLHWDVRPLQPHEAGARWGRNAAGIYTSLNAKFIRECFG